MRFVGSVRREIGIRTIFNVLGPLANPAGASMQLLGVYSEALVNRLQESFITWVLSVQWLFMVRMAWMRFR